MRVQTFVVIVLCAVSGLSARASTQVFQNDYAGFLAAAGGASVINFETLPNGLPSHAVVPITPAFNYDAQGAHFSSPIPDLDITGNATLGFELTAQADLFERTWITAQLIRPAVAVGVFFPGHTSLEVFDAGGNSIASADLIGNVSGNFLGIVTDMPIAAAVIDRGSNLSDIESFVFHSVPEPGTVVLVFVVGLLTGRRGRGRCT